MSINIIAIGKIEFVENINTVLELMDRGPNSLSQPACVKPTVENELPEPTPETPPTHRYMSNQGADLEFSNALHAFADGILPESLDEWVEWGENGLLSKEDAIEAVSSDNFAFASFNDAYTSGEQVTAALDALGLMRVPNPPV